MAPAVLPAGSSGSSPATRLQAEQGPSSHKNELYHPGPTHLGRFRLDAETCSDAVVQHPEAFGLSGAPVLSRPGEGVEVFDVSEAQLLGCQDLAFVPWRFGHALICVAASCDSEDLVRQVVLPAFFEALQVDMAAEELHQMQPVYRLAHWKEMRADFVVAGFESGGSSSLVHYLHRVPDIYIMPFELSDWARDFTLPPAAAPSCDDEPSYWPAFMSFAFWPAAETVERFNQQVLRCGTPPRRIGVWDSRYATHDIARRKIQALLADKDSARVLLCFRDPVRYVVSHFNRLSPESPGGSSLLAVVQGTDVDPDPFGLRLWKGNYTLLARKLAAAVGWERLILQPFDLLTDADEMSALLRGLGSVHSLGQLGQLPHRNRGESKRVDPCAPSVEDRSALAQLEKLYFPEFQRLRRFTGGRWHHWHMKRCPNSVKTFFLWRKHNFEIQISVVLYKKPLFAKSSWYEQD
ncbi:unnamed protein product [Cladocopium goreaui]|uniref:Sulfotransferase n=1 Tax=Cladocopium goreaui TaxID=2562237 RepID=A0A9P1D9C1_9DINO|nr:unnamed protein product [Cladocopium goreaui]